MYMDIGYGHFEYKINPGISVDNSGLVYTDTF